MKRERGGLVVYAGNVGVNGPLKRKLGCSELYIPLQKLQRSRDVFFEQILNRCWYIRCDPKFPDRKDAKDRERSCCEQKVS